MDPANLPAAGPLCNGHNEYLGRFRSHVTISGAKVLCIGFSESEIDTYISKYGCKNISVLTKWEEHRDARVTRYPLVIGDITEETVFDDLAFDVVLTLSLFEHVSDVDASMREIRRLLKPSGFLFAHLGPAWSSAFGHHIYAQPGDPLLDFSKWQLPSHLHLLATPQEIEEYYLSQQYNQQQARQALHWFFETDLINRVMFDDIMKSFCKHFQPIASEYMYNKVDEDVIALLQKKFPGYVDFSTYGGTFLFKKL